MSVSERTQIKTGKKSMVIIAMADGSKVKMRSNSAITLNSLSSNGIEVGLQAGGVFSKVIKQQGANRFRVRTPTAVAGVRGTEFFVAYGDSIRGKKEKDALMCVNEGQIEVKGSGSQKVLLNAGEGIVFNKSEKLPAPEKLPWLKKFNWSMKTDASAADETDVKEAYTSGYKDLRKQNYD